MNKLLRNLLKISLVVFAFMLIWVVEKGIIEYNKIIYDYNPLYLWGLIVLYIFALVLLYKHVIPKIVKYRWILYLLFSIFGILVVLSGIIFRVNPSWDMGTTFNIAKELVESGTYTDSFYLAQFPNNIMMAIVDIIFIKSMKFLGVSDYILGITIINSIVIIISVIFLYKIAEKIFDEKRAMLLLIICIFTTPLYMYAAEYYTDTYSIMPTVLLFWVWLKIDEKSKFSQKILWQLLFGIVLFFAMKIKITSSFVFIAIIIYEISRMNFKKILINFSISLPVTIILCILFSTFIVPKFVNEEERDLYEIPVYHWIMMGMNELGGFSYDEYAYTKSFNTLEERKKANIDKIIERTKERTLSTHLKNISAKMCFAWQDGTYWSVSIIGTEKVQKHKLHEFVLTDGEYSRYYKYIPQVMHFAMLILIVVNIYRVVREKDFDSKDIVSIISTLGIMVFLILWENRSRYVFTMILMMLMSQLNGIDYLSNKLHLKRLENRK